MTPTSQELKDKRNADFDVQTKAFREAMSTEQTQIDVTTAEIKRLRGTLKTETAEAKAKTWAGLDELTNNLDAERKHQQAAIEARMKELKTQIESVSSDLKHATGAEKAELEAQANALRVEYNWICSALTASLEGELAEAKARIASVHDSVAEKKAAAKAAFESKIADLHTRHEIAQKKLHALKQSNAAAYDELQKGVRNAVNDVKTAIERARVEIGLPSRNAAVQAKPGPPQ